MAAKIFISCGQATSREREVANRLRGALRQDGFDVYVAIQTQSIEDVNSGILRELERADYYVFIDFRRDPIVPVAGAPRFRGSLFTHQELAISYRSGFERVLFLQEEGLELEGLLRYIGGNPVVFDAGTDPTELVLRMFRERQWRPDYSRHLIAPRAGLEKALIRTPTVTGRFFFVDIENRRLDKAAYDTVARLEFLEQSGHERVPSPVRSHLKVTGQPGFSQVIWPLSHGAFDALAIAAAPPHALHLHCALDVSPVRPLIEEPGNYVLEYAVLARDFPVLRFAIEVELTGNLETTTAVLRSGS